MIVHMAEVSQVTTVNFRLQILKINRLIKNRLIKYELSCKQLISCGDKIDDINVYSSVSQMAALQPPVPIIFGFYSFLLAYYISV